MAGSSGSFSHTFTVKDIWKRGVKRYTLHVETDDCVTLKGEFRVFGHQQKYFCSGNMINTGTKPIRSGDTVEYAIVGKPTAEYKCTINKTMPVPGCKLT